MEHKQHGLSITTKDFQSTQKPKHGPMRSWLWESLSLVFAMALLITIIAVPAYYNNQILKQWPYDISLNTIIALLSTFMRASMLLVVAELVGQMGWQALRQPRPVSDIHHFNEASRGMVGAIKLFWSVPPRLVSIVAAIVIILSPAIAPFSQQAVATVPCARTVEGSQASLPVSHYVPHSRSLYSDTPSVKEVSGDLKAAMLNSLVNPTGKDTAVVVTCATGNCTFPASSKGVTHSSIAMCSSCIDTTEFIKLNITEYEGSNFRTYEFTLPDKQYVSPLDNKYLSAETGLLDWALEGVNNEFSDVANLAITNLTVLTTNQSKCWPITAGANFTCEADRFTHRLVTQHENTVAISCAFYPCIKKYHGKVQDGTLIETVIESEPVDYIKDDSKRPGEIPDSGIAQTGNRTGLDRNCLVKGKEYTMSNFTQDYTPPTLEFAPMVIDGTNYTIPNQCLYKLSFQYARALDNFMRLEIFGGTCNDTATGGGAIDCGSKWWLLPLYNSTYESLDKAFGQFTTAMTNNFRMQANKGRFSDKPDRVVGTVTEMAICTTFDYRWVLLPAGLMAITMILLICAVVQSNKDSAVPVWKTSILPLMFYGPYVVDATQETNLDELQKEAGKIRFNTAKEKFLRINPKDTEHRYWRDDRTLCPRPIKA
ncbi:hypothetical protein KAF25_010760 [Fusarium avenaceum]|uniref:Uncharacterized protein n=1 Tax=Fusarium avenaceum TaxID=40199 RepID=A0A9P7GYP4_9HYPO|nr:hypothetical protein KAF25_010760 [Fusarium avenaceum]